MDYNEVMTPTAVQAEGKVTLNGRKLNIPQEINIVGVQNDNLVENISFEIPRFFDSVNDLDQFDIRLNWTNAEKYTDSSSLEKQTNEDSLILKWKVPDKLVALDGKVEIALYGVHSDGRRWNTAPAQMEVLRGIVVSESIQKEYPDVIADLMARVKALEENGTGGSVDLSEYAKMSDVNKKLDKNQGSENNGKILGIDAQGNVIPVEKPTVIEGSGVTKEQAQALDGLLKFATYTKDVQAEYQAFKTAFGITDSGGVTPVPPVQDEWTITNNLSNVSTDNPIQSVEKGSSYMAKLTATDGFKLETVTVVMGMDITSTAYKNGTITIESVTDNIVITANAIKPAEENVTMLKSITFDGKSGLDTGYVPKSFDDEIVVGVKVNKDIYKGERVHTNIYGVSMRSNTDINKSPYGDLSAEISITSNTYNPNLPKATFNQDYNSGRSTEQVWLSTGQDTGENTTSVPYQVPFYWKIKNGDSSIWLNEELTETPVKGAFATLSSDKTYSFDNLKTPIKSIWLGIVKVHGGTMANSYGKMNKGCTIYCFKVYDPVSNKLLLNLRPAKKGFEIGMYDEVAKKFIPATLNGGQVTYEEVQ